MNVMIRDGITLHYDDFGPAAGLPVLLVHGHPFNRTLWAPQVPALTGAGYRVIAPDLRGYGDSEVTEGTVFLSRLADDLAALLDHLRVGRAVVGGVSMGGQIAMEFRCRHPQRVCALVLSDTSAPAETDEGRAVRNRMADRLLAEGMDGYAGEVIDKMLAPYNVTGQPDVAAQVLGMMRATDPRGAAAALRGRAERPDYRDTLPAVREPVLIVVGEDDVYTPVAEAEAIRRLVPHADLTVVAGAGHLPGARTIQRGAAGLSRRTGGRPRLTARRLCTASAAASRPPPGGVLVRSATGSDTPVCQAHDIAVCRDPRPLGRLVRRPYRASHPPGPSLPPGGDNVRFQRTSFRSARAERAERAVRGRQGGRSRRLLGVAAGVAVAAALALPTAQAAPAPVSSASPAALAAVSDAVQQSGVDGIAWYTDQQAGKVVVTADSSVSPAEIAQLRKGTGAVEVRRANGTFRPLLSAGAAIYGGQYRCSLGFNVQKGGAYYFLTAGHCGAVASTWYSNSGHTTLIGATQGYTFPGSDYALVRYDNTSLSHPGGYTAASATVGETVTRTGSTSGTHSGRVTALNVTVRYSGSDGGTVRGLIQTTVCAEPGDSGGPLYDGSKALGLTSGGSGDCTSGGTTFFQPVTAAASHFGVTVY